MQTIRAEYRRTLKKELKISLSKKGWSWRRFRHHIDARRDLSLAKRIKAIEYFFGVKP